MKPLDRRPPTPPSATPGPRLHRTWILAPALALALLPLAWNHGQRGNHPAPAVQPGTAPSTAAPSATATTPLRSSPAAPNPDQPADSALAIQPTPEIVAWQQRWSASDPASQPALLEEGRTLAQARVERMRELLRTRPAEALSQSLSWSQWAALPPEIREQVEQPFSTTGDYEVGTDCRPPPRTSRPSPTPHLAPDPRRPDQGVPHPRLA